MTQQPLVSIIVPIYNMERFLEETLNSIMATTYKPLEIILVNDGSTDSSLSIAQQFAERYETVRVIDQKNGGVSRARNHGIEEAKGEFILPVDADNIIEPTFVERAVDSFLTGGSDVMVVRPRIDFIGDKTGEWFFPPFTLREMASHNILDNCAMFRKSDWQRVGGYCERLLTREDWDFWMLMLEHGGRVVTLSTIELHYRVRSDSKHRQHSLHRSNVIPALNMRHPELMEMAHGGPLLRKHKKYTRLVNRLRRLLSPRRAVTAQGINADMCYFLRALPVTLETPRATKVTTDNNVYDVVYAGQTYHVNVYNECRPWPLTSHAARCSRQPLPTGQTLVGRLDAYKCFLWLTKSYLVTRG